MRMQVIDLDGSLLRQNWLCEALADGAVHRVDARDLGPALRLRASARSFAAIRARVKQAGLPMAFLLNGLLLLVQRRVVVGVDACGDYAPMRHRNWLKRIEAWRDQPRGQPANLRRKETSNRCLLQTLAESLP